MFAQDLDMKEISRTQCTKEKYKEDVWVLLMWGNGNEFGKANPSPVSYHGQKQKSLDSL